MFYFAQWLKWKSRGEGTVISGFGPLLVVVGPLLDHGFGGRGSRDY